MLPKSSNLKATQAALAKAVRLGHADPLNGYAPQRLAVYARLVRNNTFGFIDRCFVEAPNHLSATRWAETKERFIQEGKATSPYFQDIAGEFLTFCQTQTDFSADILALMDFEYTQLLAEVEKTNLTDPIAWDERTEMQLSPAAFLKSYDVDFLSSHFSQLEKAASHIIVWRNRHFQVKQQKLSELDFWLLTYLAEQPTSLLHLSQALADLIADHASLQPILAQTWTNWYEADVICPVTD
ncbi:HvfC family RiPP maturation protein [Pasteurella multocida]